VPSGVTIEEVVHVEATKRTRDTARANSDGSSEAVAKRLDRCTEVQREQENTPAQRVHVQEPVIENDNMTV
jgi:hypothetical protein